MERAESSISQPLHGFQLEPRAYFNRAHAFVYISAILALFYHRSLSLFHASASASAFAVYLAMLLSEAVFAFMWLTTLGFRWRPTRRRAFLERLAGLVKEDDLPPLDVFICTADPIKEPPMGVVNTALSVMAFDYPADKVSVYVSDDGGSELTLFAFMEAARFARHWLPFCRQNGIEDRSPAAYFRSTENGGRKDHQIKEMYEKMRYQVERAMERGKVDLHQLADDEQRQAILKYHSPQGFSRQNHPAIVQVLLDSRMDMDVSGHPLPSLVYVSREKSPASPHHFKAGALNALVRVSAEMSNAPVVLTLDCDMFSNDPISPRRALCYLLDPASGRLSPSSSLAFVQFPQRFQGIDRGDIYASEQRRLFFTNPLGMNGLKGASYVGTGCFFDRRALHSPPPSPPPVSSIRSLHVLESAHRVAGCNFEDGTDWGSTVGFRYGSLVEDYYTGYRLHCEGWKSVFCNPERAAFLGEAPMTLLEAVGQSRRWCVGLLEVGFSAHSPLTFGVARASLLEGLAYAHYAFWGLWSIAVTAYAFLPPLALLNGLHLFPKVSDPWFYLYAYLFAGAYAQDLFDFVVTGGSLRRWWSDQRMWMVKGVSSYLFGLIHFSLSRLGISVAGFTVTSKTVGEEQQKRYRRGVFEFGVNSPMFLPLAAAAFVNAASFAAGLGGALTRGGVDAAFAQLFLSGLVVVNSWPVFEAMLARSDEGKMPLQTTLASAFLAWILYFVSSPLF